MDYQKIYNQLIERGQIREKPQYYEKHHIIPKCLNGSNDINNLVFLTYREHYIAHWLLTKIYPTNHKIHYAFLCMLRGNYRKPFITPKIYATIKKNYSGFKKWHSKIVNPGQSDKSRKKAKERMLSDQNPMKKFPEKNPFLGKSYVKGRRWYNNGLIQIYLKPEEQIPIGFIPGMLFARRKKRINAQKN